MTAPSVRNPKHEAQKIFERAEHVYQNCTPPGNLEYGIDLFLQGLQLDPESVEAHARLRRFSLERKSAGGKSLGMFEKIKLSTPSGSPAQNLVNAEKLLAYDPGNVNYMLGLHRAAIDGGFELTAAWIEGIIQRASGTS
jgi:hypothetical protein